MTTLVHDSYIQDNQQCIVSILKHQLPDESQRLLVFEQGQDRVFFFFSPLCLNPRGKGENDGIALSHEWFKSTLWLLSFQYLQTTWGGKNWGLNKANLYLPFKYLQMRPPLKVASFWWVLTHNVWNAFLIIACKHTLDSFVMFLLHHRDWGRKCLHTELWIMGSALLFFYDSLNSCSSHAWRFICQSRYIKLCLKMKMMVWIEINQEMQTSRKSIPPARFWSFPVYEYFGSGCLSVWILLLQPWLMKNHRCPCWISDAHLAHGALCYPSKGWGIVHYSW